MSETQGNPRQPATKKEHLYQILILAVLAVIALMLFMHPRTKPQAPEDVSAQASTEEPAVIVRDHFVEVEREITVETIQQGLRDMGVLITGEYFFTDVITDSKALALFSYQIPFTESRYIVRYDGSVSAGIDLSTAWIAKDDELKKITVHIPPASIQTVSIDFNSFEKIEEKDGIGTRISVEDYNDGLKQLELDARVKAVDQGLLAHADENARLMISRFVGSLVDTSQYTLDFVSDSRGR